MPKGVYERKPFTEEHRRKMSIARKGKISWNKGKKMSDETKRKIGKANKGHRGYMLGKHHSKESKRKISEGCMRDDNNINIGTIHQRAHKIISKPIDGICELCNNIIDRFGKIKLEHSNKDHSYKMPINPDDWQWVHHSCHFKYDYNKNLLIKKTG